MFDPSTKILVIDDMMAMRKVVKKILKDLGFSDIHEAADGNLAWDLIQTEKFGLVISDWNMPNCSGLELLKRVRDSQFKDVPFILVTAEAEAHQVSQAISSGVDQYVVKPFTQDGLKTKLGMAYKKCSARKSA